MKFLEISNLHVYYEEGHILQGVSLSVNPGEMIGIIGRNGVGKTTLLKSIIGLLKIRNGKIIFKGEDITKLSAHEIARKGMSYIPQGREIYGELSVLENLKLGSLYKKENTKISLNLIFEYFPILKERIKQKGNTLSGGEQQMLAIARALLAEPSLLLMDEPTEGLSPYVVGEIKKYLKIMNEDLGLSIILVEQNVELTFSLVNRVYLMEKGKVVKEGRPSELRDDNLVKKYLTI